MNTLPEPIVKCRCQQCNGHLEFDLRQCPAGQTISCPHCSMETQLYIPATQRIQEITKRKVSVPKWIVVVSCCLMASILCAVALAFAEHYDGLGALLGGIFSMTFALLAAVAVAFIYFLPTVVAHKKRNSSAIFVLNFFLGWTLLGWVIALVWASMRDPEPSK